MQGDCRIEIYENGKKVPAGYVICEERFKDYKINLQLEMRNSMNIRDLHKVMMKS